MRTRVAKILGQIARIAYGLGFKTVTRACATYAARLAPSSDLHHALAACHFDSGDYNGVLARAMTAHMLAPNDPAVMQTIGTTLYQLGQNQAAESWLVRSLCIQPRPLAWWGYAEVLLQQGDYTTGFSAYEARQVPPSTLRGLHRLSGVPRWDGTDLTGKTVLIWTEQGSGDAIQFIRYAPLVAQRGARVIVLCPPALRRLFSTAKGIDSVICSYGPEVGRIDYQIPDASLPHRFQTTTDTIPGAPYLSAPEESTIQLSPGTNVGLVWAPGQLETAHLRSRAVRLEHLLPLITGPDIAWHSLQVGLAVAEIKELGLSGVIQDLAPRLKDFADTAAVISQLDLVITVDTAVAHLAGALGRPVWILLPYGANWRWLQDREDSPWYPTARLFRQPWPGNWIAPVLAVREALRSLVGQGKVTSSAEDPSALGLQYAS